ncbi:response regulator [Promethearchaeum syntrophicum]|uniref:Response regulator n=1 Tax=Promethearchaeum syntrophicum TaxID=2594042 RepID=A0A5B9DCU5_9ARCH|nr:response regulator [Candidatus Prometheoarchaeum syntrophicum]QEE16942.1 acetoacetate metabolism regulatory protein AtoC [Candidatus Prometheoarchaeum syntrophicum]
MSDTKSKNLGHSLVMDDDPLIRKTIQLLLLKLGFASTLVKNGEDAVNHFIQAQKDKKPFNFVILDLIIPDGMGGKETLDKIRQIDPNVKIILSSGYKKEILENYKELGFNSMLEKPYTISELKQAISVII